jgi:hypothetical protein
MQYMHTYIHTYIQNVCILLCVTIFKIFRGVFISTRLKHLVHVCQVVDTTLQKQNTVRFFGKIPKMFIPNKDSRKNLSRNEPAMTRLVPCRMRFFSAPPLRCHPFAIISEILQLCLSVKGLKFEIELLGFFGRRKGGNTTQNTHMTGPKGAYFFHNNKEKGEKILRRFSARLFSTVHVSSFFSQRKGCTGGNRESSENEIS